MNKKKKKLQALAHGYGLLSPKPINPRVDVRMGKYFEEELKKDKHAHALYHH
jgi:hypothetical protein